MAVVDIGAEDDAAELAGLPNKPPLAGVELAEDVSFDVPPRPKTPPLDGADVVAGLFSFVGPLGAKKPCVGAAEEVAAGLSADLFPMLPNRLEG